MTGLVLSDAGTDPAGFDEFADHLWRHYRLTPDQISPTTTPGYWQRSDPCGGHGVCRSELHACVGCEGSIRHTVSYFDRGRDRGQFASPYRTWRAAARAYLGEQT